MIESAALLWAGEGADRRPVCQKAGRPGRAGWGRARRWCVVAVLLWKSICPTRGRRAGRSVDLNPWPGPPQVVVTSFLSCRPSTSRGFRMRPAD